MDDETEAAQAAPKRPAFKVAGMASIKHLNVRKEGPDDEKILACDLKLEIKNVDRRLCAYFDPALEGFLWRGETNALIARNIYLAPIAYANEVKSATVKIGSQTFIGCEAKKFAMEPRDGGVMTLTCSVSVYPRSGDVSDLADMVQGDAPVEIEAAPDLFAEPTTDDGAQLGDPTTQLPLAPQRDELYAQAEALVRKENRASISMVQRHLMIGYNRAANILEQLQDGGVVSPMDAAGKRHVHKTTTGEQQ